MTLRRIALLFAFVSSTAGIALAQTSDESIQTPLSKVGVAPSSVYQTDQESVDLTTGNVFWSLPLLALEGRGGQSLQLTYRLNSRTVQPYISEVPYSPVSGTMANGIFTGWRGISGVSLRINVPTLEVDTAALAQEVNPSGPEAGQPTADVFCNTNYGFIDDTGSRHAFSNISSCYGTYAHPEYNTPITDATDGSLMRLDTTDTNDIKLFQGDGSVVHFHAAETDVVDRNGNQIRYVFSNGQLDIIDNVGRDVTVAGGLAGGSDTGTISWRGESGATQTITISSVPKSDPVTLSYSCSDANNTYTLTNTQTFPGQFDPPAAHTTTINFSGTTPRTYTVDVDELGEIEKISLPTGGYIRYEYADHLAPQQLVGSYVRADCSSISHRQLSAKYVCSSTSGSCSQEDTTTFTPTINAYNMGENAAMDVRNADGRTHHEFQVFYTPGGGSVGVLETLNRTYQGESQELSSASTSYTQSSSPYSISFLPQKSSVTTVLDGFNGDSNVSTSTQYLYFSKPYLCTGYQGTTPCVGSSEPPTSQPTPLVSSEKTYGYDGALALDRETTWSGYQTSTVFNWSLQSMVTESGKGGVYRRTDYEYDSTRYPLVARSAYANVGHEAQRGNVTQITRYANGDSNPLSQQFGYDDTGNVVLSKDPRGYTSSSDYADSWSTRGCSPLQSGTYAYPTSATDALAEQSHATYNYCTGSLLEATDINQKTTTYSYDDFQRNLRVDFPDGGWSSHSRSDVAPAYDTTTTAQTSSSSVVNGINYDGLGRVSTKWAQEAGSTKIQQDYQYDAVGRPHSVSNPYRSPGAATGWTTTTYDALSRIASVAMSDGTSSKQTHYSANHMTDIDEVQNSTQKTFDELEHLNTVVEANGATTTYTITAFGDLTSVSQSGLNGEAARNTRSFGYDSLSRLTYLSNPETGNASYSYTNTDGSLCAGVATQACSKTDSRNVATAYSYDPLNRLISRKVSGGGLATQSSCYAYGTSSSLSVLGVGRLLGEWTQPADCPPTPTATPSSGVLTSRSVTSFDPMGRPKGEVRCVLAQCNTSTPQSYGYNYAGNLTSYNDGRGAYSFTQSFDIAGRFQAVQRASGGVLAPVLNINAYDPAGWNDATLGTVLSEKRTFDSRMRVQGETVTKP